MNIDWTLRFSDVLAVLGIAAAAVWWFWGVQGKAKAALAIAARLEKAITELNGKIDSIPTKQAFADTVHELERQLAACVTRDLVDEKERQAHREHSRLEAELGLHAGQLRDLNSTLQKLQAIVEVKLGVPIDTLMRGGS